MLWQSAGNPFCHLTLRGGASGPNYDAASVARASEAASRAGCCSRVLVDASHGNSGKDHENQRRVTSDVAARVAAGAPRICSE